MLKLIEVTDELSALEDLRFQEVGGLGGLIEIVGGGWLVNEVA
ncbi:hypothetical protein [Vibrio methylphosphonaticus]|nr:hypothetical protein [Vibrio methylphosphonaticus]